MTKLDAGDRASVTRLVSRSCTTGWADWVWGDLWLTPDTLVRVARGWDESRDAARERKRRGGGSTVEPGAPVATPTDDALRAALAEDRRNRSIALDEIEQARLRRGITTSRLAVVLRDGRKVKLLWLKDDPAHDALQAVLQARLGARLRLR